MFGKLSGVIGQMNINGALSGPLNQILNNGGQREQFIAVLLASVDHVSKKQSFNLEVEINDLNVRLGNLRQTGGLGGVMGQMGQMMRQMTDLTQGLTQAAQGVIRNMR